jgi:hypothetical protein
MLVRFKKLNTTAICEPIAYDENSWEPTLYLVYTFGKENGTKITPEELARDFEILDNEVD